jgi:Tfp pilus assembly protein PilX
MMEIDGEMNIVRHEEGVALLTVLLIMTIMTIIGIAAITVTSLENRLAGFSRTSEAAVAAAESCTGTAVNIIQQTIDQGSVPATFLDNANPIGPVPQNNQAVLTQEIMGQSDNNTDNPVAAPNTVTNVNSFVVRGDIDRLYAKPKAGGSLQFASGYEGTAGGAAGGGIDVIYRINCVATNTTTNTTSQITVVYACTATGESCQKKI